MRTSILGSGNSSFGHALLRSWKSMQVRTCPFSFLTGTMLANHVGYLIGLINLTVISYSTSSLTCISILGWKLHLPFLTGFDPGSMFREWQTISGFNPGISSQFPTNTSWYYFSKLVSLCLLSAINRLLMETGFLALGSLLSSTSSKGSFTKEVSSCLVFSTTIGGWISSLVAHRKSCLLSSVVGLSHTV